MQRKLKIQIIGTLLILLLTACGESQSAQVSPVNPVNIPTVAATPTQQATQSPTVAATSAVPATTAPATTQAATTAPATTAVTTARPTTVVPATTARPTTAVPATTVAPQTTALSQTQRQAIRKTNWLEVLKAEPNLEKTQETFPTGKPELYVTTKDGKKVGGFPSLEPIQYVDMDGDGLEDAALTLYSGGTAGDIGFLVYRQTAKGPAYVGAADGYKLNLEIQQGKLIAHNMLYAFWEPNCCPGGFSSATYVIKDGKLSVVAETTEGFPKARLMAVQQFYFFIDQRNFKDAYSLLSDSYQAANPYAKWVAGFANTTKVEAEVNEDPSGAVKINLTSTDTVGGKAVTKKYIGTWKLVWDANVTGWRLNEASINEAK